VIGNWLEFGLRLGFFSSLGHACRFGLGTPIGLHSPLPPNLFNLGSIVCLLRLKLQAPPPPPAAKDLGEYSKHARLQIENLLSARPDLAKTTGEPGLNGCTKKNLSQLNKSPTYLSKL